MSSRRSLAVLGVLGAVTPVGVSIAAQTPPVATPAREVLNATIAGHSIGDQMRAAVRHRRLVVRNVRLAQKVQGKRLRRGYAAEVNVWTDAHLRRDNKRLEAKVKRMGATTASVSVSPLLQKIAQCESHGNPRSIGGGGLYRGKYQMTYSSWAAVGGHGDPAAAPEAEQDQRAAMLLAQSGPGQWPVCSR